LYWKETKHVLKYLRGTSEYGLWYRRTEGVKLQVLNDAYWAWSPSDRKSISGAIFTVESTTISEYNMKQRFVALNSGEIE